jgi:hypothetical protein
LVKIFADRFKIRKTPNRESKGNNVKDEPSGRTLQILKVAKPSKNRDNKLGRAIHRPLTHEPVKALSGGLAYKEANPASSWPAFLV